MRAIVVVFVWLVALLAGARAASAAELPAPHARQAPVFAWPIEPVVIVDDNPGVTTRAYWLPPWGNRHYFPATGVRPRIGRREVLSLRRSALPRAERYSRSWSTSSVFATETPPQRVLLYPIEPWPQRGAPRPDKP